MSAQWFAGEPRFIKAQLQQDYSFVKRGMCAVPQERKLTEVVATFTKQFPHTRDVRLGRVRFYLQQLGMEKLTEIANKNLSSFLFRRACDKAIGINL